MRLIHFFLSLGILFSLASCSKMRRLAGFTEPQVLPPVKITGVPNVPADQRPIIKTEAGFVVSSIPGVTLPPEEPGEKIIYVGPSN